MLDSFLRIIDKTLCFAGFAEIYLRNLFSLIICRMFLQMSSFREKTPQRNEIFGLIFLVLCLQMWSRTKL